MAGARVCVAWVSGGGGGGAGRTIGSRGGARSWRKKRECRVEAVREPCKRLSRAFAPATVANLGVGFDFLGCAVEGQGDVVEARLVSREEASGSEIVVESMEGDGGRLSLVADENCCGIAARETVKLLGGLPEDQAIALRCLKGLPLGSGLGSSAASAAAAAWAVNGLYDYPLTPAELVPAGLESEATVSGYHADNIAPSLMGGFVLVETYEPLTLHRLGFPSQEGKEMWFALVTPVFEAPTKEMRAALPKEISMSKHTSNCSAASSLIAGLLQGDAAMVGRTLNADVIVEPKRGPLIPGFAEVKAAAIAAGAHGATISGAGPTIVAVASGEEEAQAAAKAMMKAFSKFHEIGCAVVAPASEVGAREVEQWEIPRTGATFLT